MQGIESNIKHHRRLLPILWPETRYNDAFVHYPHGGRLDSRFRRGNNYNDSMTVGLPAGQTWAALLYAYYTNKEGFLNQAFQGDAALPAVPYSHLLNYDYFKTSLPEVRHPSDKCTAGIALCTCGHCSAPSGANIDAREHCTMCNAWLH